MRERRNRRAASVRIGRSESWRQPLQPASACSRIARIGWLAGTRRSRSRSYSCVLWDSGRPRMAEFRASHSDVHFQTEFFSFVGCVQFDRTGRRRYDLNSNEHDRVLIQSGGHARARAAHMGCLLKRVAACRRTVGNRALSSATAASGSGALPGKAWRRRYFAAGAALPCRRKKASKFSDSKNSGISACPLPRITASSPGPPRA